MKIGGLDDKYTNTGNYMICYFDILGTKYKLSKFNKEVFGELWLINHCLEKYSYKWDDIVIRTFSDNYFIAFPTNANIRESLVKMLTIVGMTYAECLTSIQTPLRGYITSGDMHIDENSIIGEPLIKAYEFESRVAKYPRICIDINLWGIEDNDVCSLKNGVYIDKDLMPCLNVLKYIDPNYLLTIKNTFWTSLIEDISVLSDDALSKRLWLINYVNDYYLQNFGEKAIEITKLKNLIK